MPPTSRSRLRSLFQQQPTSPEDAGAGPAHFPMHVPSLAASFPVRSLAGVGAATAAPPALPSSSPSEISLPLPSVPVLSSIAPLSSPYPAGTLAGATLDPAVFASPPPEREQVVITRRASNGRVRESHGVALQA